MRLLRFGLLIGLVVPLAGACGGGAIGSQQTCQQLTDEYTNAYPAALACVPGAANQCQQQAKSASNCDCNGTVQDATQLDAIVAQMTALGCIPQKGPACPCAYLGPVSCVADDAGGGTCTASLR
jgi:hypothetical protein